MSADDECQAGFGVFLPDDSGRAFEADGAGIQLHFVGQAFVGREAEPDAGR